MSENTPTYVRNVAPAKLELLIVIVNASKLRYYANLIQSAEINMQIATLVSGTSERAIMNYLGLNQSSRAAIFAVIREDKIKELLEFLDTQFSTVKDGGGIAVTVPLSSIIGTMAYGFLSNDKRTVKDE